MSKQMDPLPCPFCGHLPVIEPWHGGAKTKRLVSCDNYECHVVPMVSGPTRGVAVAKWNTREPKGKR